MRHILGKDSNQRPETMMKNNPKNQGNWILL